VFTRLRRLGAVFRGQTMRLLLTTCLVLACLFAAGCAPLKPYRTEWREAATPADCNPTPEPDDPQQDTGGYVDKRCANRIREDAANYSLYFAEFDDQGWAYPKAQQYGAAAGSTTPTATTPTCGASVRCSTRSTWSKRRPAAAGAWSVSTSAGAARARSSAARPRT
jgi:hypothetical protein